jgi:hypothetical protein
MDCSICHDTLARRGGCVVQGNAPLSAENGDDWLQKMMTFVWKMPFILMLIISMLTLGAVYGARLPDDYRCVRIVTGSNYGAGFDEGNLGYAIYDLGSGQYRDDPRANPPLRVAAAPDGQRQAELERAGDGSYTLWIRNAEALTPDPSPLGRGEKFTTESLAIRLQTGIAPAMILRNANLLVGWSPDSSRIAYLWAAQDGQMYLSTANADGSARQTALFTRSDGATDRLFDVRVYGWSADNAVIAIAEGQADWSNRYAFWSAADLRRIEREGEEPHPQPLSARREGSKIQLPSDSLANNVAQEPLYRGVWSPQGQVFAAIYTAAGRQALKLIVPTENRELVVDGLPNAPIELIAWSPDSRSLVLITYASVCGTPCASHWRYDFYDSSGARLASNVIGARLAQGGASDIDTPPTGRTVTAAWFGDEWWFLSESNDLAALDVASGETRVIAEGVMPRFGDEIFYISAWRRSRMRVMNNFTLLPDGDHLLVATEREGKIRVELISRESRQTLVDQADTLFSRDENGSRFWLWDGAWAAIPWSMRGESTRLTLAQVGTSFSQTVDGGYDTISSIYPANQDWVGYIGRRGNERALEMVNAQTGERRKLLNSLGTHPFWDVTFGGGDAGIFVRSGRDALFRGLVYLVSAEGRARQVGGDAVNAPMWSPDGAGFALMRLDNRGAAVLEILGPDGSVRQQANLGQFLATQPAVEGWTRCD